MSEVVIQDHHTVAHFGDLQPPAAKVDQGQVFSVHTRDRFAALATGATVDKAHVRRLVGPVHITGVEPGDVVRVDVLDIVPRTGIGYLLASPGYGILGETVETRVRPVQLSAEQVQLTDDVCVKAQPMIGKLGLTSAQSDYPQPIGSYGGAFSTVLFGINASVLLRATTSGGNLLLEDVHALMGDGEATASAVEMAATVRLRCSVFTTSLDQQDDTALPLPLLLNTEHVCLFASGHSADEALLAATERAIKLLMTHRQVDRTEAALLVGAAVDTQVSFLGARPVVARACVPRALTAL